jgi:hypothetical protein
MQDFALSFIQWQPSVFPLQATEPVTPVIKFKYPIEDQKNHPINNQFSSVRFFYFKQPVLFIFVLKNFTSNSLK